MSDPQERILRLLEAMSEPQEQILRLLAELAGNNLQPVVKSAIWIDSTANRDVTRTFLNICEQTLQHIRDEHFPREAE